MRKFFFYDGMKSKLKICVCVFFNMNRAECKFFL